MRPGDRKVPGPGRRPRPFLVLAAASFLGVFALAAAAEVPAERVVVLGFDGADPDEITAMIAEGELPNLARLGAEGTLAPLGTTRPSESPVAWATFATGMNPGRTGIFDFLEKGEAGYTPQIALVREGTRRISPALRWSLLLLVIAVMGWLTRVAAARWLPEVKVAGGVPSRRVINPYWFVGTVVVLTGFAGHMVLQWIPEELPQAIRARQGDSFWKIAGGAGVPTVALQAPMDFPVEESPGARVLAGFGVPDVRKSFGLWSIYSTDLIEEESTETGGTRYPLRFENGIAASVVRGPRDFTAATDEADQPEVGIPVLFRKSGERLEIETAGRSFHLAVGEWSAMVPITFTLNPLVRLSGLLRFRLLSLEPNVEVFMEPVNFDPERLPPIVDLSWPRDFAGDMARHAGPFETIGWKIITNPLRDGVVDFDAFLEDARFARESNERLLREAVRADDWRLLVAVFLFPDRIQHMLYRFADPEHPNHDAELAVLYGDEIRQTYREMDRIVGETVAAAPPGTRFIVLSDHGFHSFRYQFNVNTWLAEHGYLRSSGGGGERRLEDLFDPHAVFFPGVDWGRSEAFALGLSGIYFNQEGREPQGIVAPGAEREALAERLIADLLAYRDPENGQQVVRVVHRREDIYEGEFVDEAPDLILGLEPGYRIGWQSTLGGFPEAAVTPNLDNWSGDHCSMEDTDGVLIANFDLEGPANLRDMAPTILQLLGVGVPSDMDGASLVPGAPDPELGE